MGREDDRLDLAAARGIITVEQAAAIRALGDKAPSAESPRTANATTLAYIVGAVTVVVAMGWFLGDRWDELGPWGVLATCAVYAAVFLVTMRRLRSEGFPVASGFALLLAVGIVPIATTALIELNQWFEPLEGQGCYDPVFDVWSCRGREILAELTTTAAALFALRKVRFSLLVLPIAGIAVRFLFHASATFGSDWFGRATDGWIWMFGASLLTAAAYETDRRQRGDEDFARWWHVAAALCALAASAYLLGNEYPFFHHLLIPGALVAFAAALLLRRFVWLGLGMVWFVWYLIWLAREVFRDSPAFPIVLAALGIGVIIGTVWVQRNAKMLVARFGTVTSDGRPRFPGGTVLLLAPALVALLMFSDGRARDAERRAALRWQSHRFAIRQAREARVRREKEQAQPNTPSRGTKGETPPLNRP